MSDPKQFNPMNFLALSLLAVIASIGGKSYAAFPCDAGRQAALHGEVSSAIASWEIVFPYDESPKSKLASVLKCLRDSGIATDNTAAAQWMVAAADTAGGRANLYAGMILASGAGLASDIPRAIKYLERARKAAPKEAAKMLGYIEAERVREK